MPLLVGIGVVILLVIKLGIGVILFIFEETNIRVNGKYERLPDDFVPRSTDVVIPVTSRVTALDDYLRDVQRS